jgi:hypothetical protein
MSVMTPRPIGRTVKDHGSNETRHIQTRFAVHVKGDRADFRNHQRVSGSIFADGRATRV